MPDHPPSRRHYLQIDAVDPATGKSIAVQISHERLQTVARRSLGHAKEAAYIVPLVLQKPAAIFEGLRQDADEDRRGAGWRCYCAVPTHAYRTDGTPMPSYPGQVYLVFVNDDRVAYNWRWEKADPANPAWPVDYDKRFRTRRL